MFRNAQNMIVLRRRFKQKITTVGEKGKATKQLKNQEEEAVKKRQKESEGLRLEDVDKEKEQGEKVVEELQQKVHEGHDYADQEKT